MNLSTPNTRHCWGHHGSLALFIHNDNDDKGFETLGDAVASAGRWMQIQERLAYMTFISATPRIREDAKWEVEIVADIAETMEELFDDSDD